MCKCVDVCPLNNIKEPLKIQSDIFELLQQEISEK